MTRKLLTLKMKVKVMKYTNSNGSIRWQISTSIKVIIEKFSLALTVFQIFTFHSSWPWKCMLKSCGGATRWQIPDFLFKGCIFPAWYMQKIANWKDWLRKLWFFRSYAIRQRISTYIKVIRRSFAQAATIFEKIIFTIVDLENVDQGHDSHDRITPFALTLFDGLCQP